MTDDDRLRDDDSFLTPEERLIKTDPVLRDLAGKVNKIYQKIGGPQAIMVQPHPTAHVADRLLVEWLFGEGGPFYGRRLEYEREVLRRFVAELEQIVEEGERQRARSSLLMPPGGARAFPGHQGPIKGLREP